MDLTKYSCLDIPDLDLGESGDNFPDLVNGKIDIIAYLNNSGANGGAPDTLPSFLDELLANRRAMLTPHDMLNHNGHGHPMYMSHAGGAKMAQAGPTTVHHHPSLRLPDSPPDTDSGAGSAGSPSGGSAASSSSPGYPSHTQHHTAATHSGVIHPPVGGGGVAPPPGHGGLGVDPMHHSHKGLILSVPELNHHMEFPSPAAPHQQQAMSNSGNGVGLSPNSFTVPRPPSTQPQSAQQLSPSYPPLYDATALMNARKRPRSDSLDSYHHIPSVKPEPISPQLTDDSFYEDSFTHQAIRFFEFQRETWHQICDVNGRELLPLGFHVVADKGFNYSPNDQAFINQKKNHFQITVQIGVQGRQSPKFVRIDTENGSLLKPIKDFRLDFYGVKSEMASSTVMIKQSQSDRKPVPYEPGPIDLPPNRITKITVQRLHFSETTLNNQRKNGRPNPDQKYFQLVVALKATDPADERHIIAAYASERVIVRASNPGQFDSSENEGHWQRGTTPGSVCFQGPVGIGTATPQAALHVHGDMHVVGKITNPSDLRLKHNIEEYNTADALSRMSQIRIVRYDFRPDVVKQFNLDPEDASRVGVIAQEVEALLPDAVREDGSYMKVDESRIFYESAAAVKELCRLTGNLEYKIDEVEKIANKCNRLREKLRRVDSFLSLSSDNSAASRNGHIAGNGNCYVGSGSQISMTNSAPNIAAPSTNNRLNGKAIGGSSYIERLRQKRHNACYCEQVNRGICRSRVLQGTIVALVAVMALCLVAMAVLYILDWHHRQKVFPMPVHSLKSKGHNGKNLGDLDKSGIGVDPGKMELSNPGGSDEKDGWLAHPGWSKTPTPPPLHAYCVGMDCQAYCCPQPKLVLIKPGQTPDQKDLYHLEDGSIDGLIAPQKDLKNMAYQVMLSPNKDKSSKTPQQTPFLSNATVKRNKRAAAEAASKSGREPNSRIVITNLNQTWLEHDKYCVGSSCNNLHMGRFIYRIPISKYMPHMPLEIRFDISDDQFIELCSHKMGDRCEGLEKSPASDVLFSEGSMPGPHQRHFNIWELPVGSHSQSSYTFRVAYSSPCMLSPDDAGVAYEEYRLAFERVCE